MAERVQFFFDVICPFAYQTSLWIRSIRDDGVCEVDWRLFSLEEVNREPDSEAPWELDWSPGWSLLRVAAFLRRRDPALVDAWYAACGRGLHEEGRPVLQREGAVAVIAEMGLPAGTVDAALADPSTHDDVRADHDWLVAEKAGFGVPTLVFEDGAALFGPVVVPAPEGAEALRLWELVGTWREFPHLYELKRPKTDADHAHIADMFNSAVDTGSEPSTETPTL